MILIDMSQVMLGNIFAFGGKGIHESDENLMRHMTLNSIRLYKNKFKSYGDVILVFDSNNYWRKEIFPQYKAARKIKQNKNAEDWSRIWESINAIRVELEEQFPYKTMRVERAEADDIIAHLAKKYHKSEKIMIISSDKDYQQLQRYPNISQYSVKTKEKLVCKKPQEYLIEHIIKGDSSDGIPNILSEDDAIINKEKRQKRVTQKVLDTIKEDLAFGELPKGHEENWKRNQELVDFEKIPNWIIQSIEEKWKEEIKGHRRYLFNYFIEHRLKNLMEHISEF